MVAIATWAAACSITRITRLRQRVAPSSRGNIRILVAFRRPSSVKDCECPGSGQAFGCGTLAVHRWIDERGRPTERRAEAARKCPDSDRIRMRREIIVTVQDGNDSEEPQSVLPQDRRSCLSHLFSLGTLKLPRSRYRDITATRERSLPSAASRSTEQSFMRVSVGVLFHGPVSKDHVRNGKDFHLIFQKSRPPMASSRRFQYPAQTMCACHLHCCLPGSALSSRNLSK